MMDECSIQTINEIDQATFVEIFGDVAEHSPWVARKASDFRPFETVDQMSVAFAKIVSGADVDQQLDLICAHPDLAGKAAITGQLAEASAQEQAQAGIGELTEAEFKKFSDYNSRYKDRFGFPFILAVKGATKEQILSSFAERVDNDRRAEFKRALSEICRIIRFRLEAKVRS